MNFRLFGVSPRSFIAWSRAFCLTRSSVGYACAGDGDEDDEGEGDEGRYAAPLDFLNDCASRSGSA